MRRALIVGAACLALVSCSKAPGGSSAGSDQPGDASVAASGVAFTYAYLFRLPSARIAAAQEEHAEGCERLGPARCRITGMSYHVDGSGEVAASLSVRLDAAIARRFGRAGVDAIERAGGALADADIQGTDAASTLDAAQRQHADNGIDQAEVERQLARPDLRPAERAQLLQRRDAIVQGVRDTGATIAAARDSVAQTPMQFTYRAGAGVGLGASLADAGHLGWNSLVTTLSIALSGVAALGPPAALLALLALSWLAGRRWWAGRQGVPPA